MDMKTSSYKNQNNKNIFKNQFDDIPSRWRAIQCDSLLYDAAKRGYYFSQYFVGNIKERRICLMCGGLNQQKECSLNCICNTNQKITKIRKLIRNVMFFVHEILLQNEGITNCLPYGWPKIIIDKSDEESRKIIEKRMQIIRFRGSTGTGAFSMYNKNTSLEKFALFLENILIEMVM